MPTGQALSVRGVAGLVGDLGASELLAPYPSTSVSALYAQSINQVEPLGTRLNAAWCRLDADPNVANATECLVLASAQVERGAAAHFYPGLVERLGWQALGELDQARVAADRTRAAFQNNGLGGLANAVSGLLLGGAGYPEPARTALAGDVLLGGRSGRLALFSFGADMRYRQEVQAYAVAGVTRLVEQSGQHFVGGMAAGRRRAFNRTAGVWPVVAYAEALRAHGIDEVPLPVTLIRMRKLLEARRKIPPGSRQIESIPRATNRVLTFCVQFRRRFNA